jgi:hypothetical protein
LSYGNYLFKNHAGKDVSNKEGNKKGYKNIYIYPRFACRTFINTKNIVNIIVVEQSFLNTSTIYKINNFSLQFLFSLKHNTKLINLSFQISLFPYVKSSSGVYVVK